MSEAIGNTPVPLEQLARVIRSKNAGPLTLTLDLIFDGPEPYAIAAAALPKLHAEVAERYDVALDAVKVIPYPIGHAIKISLPRKVIAGNVGDTDAYGAQQHVPLLDILV